MVLSFSQVQRSKHSSGKCCAEDSGYRLVQKYLMKNVTCFNIDKREKYFATIIQSNILGPALTRQTGWRCLIQLSEKSLIKTRGSEIIWAGDCITWCWAGDGGSRSSAQLLDLYLLEISLAAASPAATEPCLALREKTSLGVRGF